MPAKRSYRKRAGGKRKRYAPKRKSVTKRLNTKNSGYININRRLPLLSIAAGNTAGSPAIRPVAQTALLLGTPTQTVGGSANTYDVPFSLTFRLDQLQNFTEFTQLFDCYKINGVKVVVRSFANMDMVSTGGAAPFVAPAPMPFIEYWTDPDSNITPTVDQSREVMGTRITYFNATTNTCRMYLKPTVRAQVNTIDGTASAIVHRGGWLDCAAPSVLHYAIKGIIHNYTLPAASIAQNNLIWDITQNVSFKEVI